LTSENQAKSCRRFDSAPSHSSRGQRSEVSGQTPDCQDDFLFDPQRRHRLHARA